MRFHLDRNLLVIALVIIWTVYMNEVRRSLQNVKFLPKTPGTKNIHYWKRPPWVSKDFFYNCKHKCEMTEGEYIPENSDAVIFHTPELWVGQPPAKPKGQIWVFHGLEPPMNYKMSYYNWHNVFNWTMSYRRDADIYQPYGIFQNPTFTKPIQKIFKPWLKKTAAWFVGNCHSQSKREQFVKLLQLYVDVDVYGYCGTRTCIKHGKDHSCLDLLNKSYNFYLSFESSLCRDYVTEKFFKVFKTSNVVPVVRGNAHYNMYGPPGSFIDSANFTSTRKLAQHLSSVAMSEKIFSTFLKFRESYDMHDDFSYPFCELCRRVHNAPAYQRLYNDIGQWLYGSDKVPICIRPKDLS
ncbi:alpha-(1,3)-fucosyltransferase C-like [Mizuhopecten yessoensis]|uniref:Fucosyltransferase n=1 Tax=Mizuhopecten yessoensis TaxID=6573 RepID=A0A210PEQ7_MIZYE|nr:alpha-(1,3)-fucosyltransferase C-like [Mizuhopecten yessoensis]OWF34969.1 Alpha-(1,3)-fucosyltransferase C [Mizuhopecten yessoensis]